MVLQVVVQDILVHHLNHLEQVVKPKVTIFAHDLFIQRHVIPILINMVTVKELRNIENNMETAMTKMMKVKVLFNIIGINLIDF